MGANRWSDAWVRELSGFADALFPRACRLCGAAALDDFACPEHSLPPAEPRARCDRCAALHAPSLPDGARCGACRRDPPGWSRLIALADYGRDPGLRSWVLAMKHGGRRDLAQPLGELLARRVREECARNALELRDTLVTSVPLHATRRFVRGYDQAALLARFLALGLGSTCLRTLVRMRATPPQGAPGSRSRASNVRGAFRWRPAALPRIRGRILLLVDDVVTSGATAGECARCLRRAGAAEVVVACLARASPRRSD